MEINLPSCDLAELPTLNVMPSAHAQEKNITLCLPRDESYSRLVGKTNTSVVLQRGVKDEESPKNATF